MSNLDYTELVRNHLYLVTGYTRYTHHVPHVQHVESCRSDEMAKHGRDVIWSLLTATSYCPLSILQCLCSQLVHFRQFCKTNTVRHPTQWEVWQAHIQLCFGSTWFVMVVMMFFFWQVVREDVSLNIYLPNYTIVGLQN